ncbi:MAG: hypothetical protein Q8P18_19675 [Pseudomonadota bacterium]|nr:hypothetical protein [Pseudomonadota bacterium]
MTGEVEAVTEAPADIPEIDTAIAGGFSASVADPRRGLLWAGAAPMEPGTGRIGGGVAGAWFATWKGLQVAGGGAEVDASWAPTRRFAVTLTAGVGAGGVRPAGVPAADLAAEGLANFFTLTPAAGWATFASARYLALDAPGARVAPFLAGGLGAVGAGPAGEVAPIGIVGGGVAVEVPFYDVVFDLALPLGGLVVTGELPGTIPLAVGPFAPLFLLGEAGFTWTIGPRTTFRLGYIALATSYSWRYRNGPLTVEVSGHTNFLSANASMRVGWGF